MQEVESANLKGTYAIIGRASYVGQIHQDKAQMVVVEHWRCKE